MPVLDASSIIYAWDEYPLEKFPKLWEWMESEIFIGNLSIPGVAYEEVSALSDECAQWLKTAGIEKLEISSSIIATAMNIKSFLQIVGDAYHPNGVGENDILIISSARVKGDSLISNEAVQTNKPQVISKSKIPLVCKMHGVQVVCMNFRDYFMTSNQAF